MHDRTNAQTHTHATPQKGGRFATAKFCVQQALPAGQLGLSAQVPLVKAAPDEAMCFGLSLSLGM